MNTSLKFNGNSYIEIAISNMPLGNSARTIECWFKIDNGLNVPNYSCMFSYGTAVRGTPIFMLTIKDNKLFTETGSGSNSMISNNVVNDGLWHHACISHNGTVLSLYLDSVLQSTSTSYISTEYSNFMIGEMAWERNRYFKGDMDEIRIWNRCLSESEIKLNYRKPLIGNESGLICYYNFNEGNGSITKDITSYKNDANIVNATWNNYGFSMIAYILQSKINNKLYNIINNNLNELTETTINENLFFLKGMSDIPTITENMIDVLQSFKILQYNSNGFSNLNLSGNYKNKIYKLIPNSKLLMYTDDNTKTKIFNSVKTTENYKPYDKLSNEFEIHAYK